MDFLGIIYSILAFIVAIGILVTVHEFGSFLGCAQAGRQGIAILGWFLASHCG